MYAPLTQTPDNELRVLRVGLLHDGQIVAERLLGPDERLSVGRSRRCTLVVDDPGFARRLVLVEPAAGGSILLLGEGMTGRVALPSGVHELVGQREVVRVRLDRRSRGRVQIGAWTLLFQWVVAPPVPLRTTPSFRPSLIGEGDSVFAGSLGSYTAFAAIFFAFLSQVPVQAEVTSFDEMPERYADILRTTVAPPEPVPGEVEETRSAAERRQDRREERRAEREERREDREEARAARQQRSEAEQLAEVQQRVLELLGTRGDAGRVDVFASSDAVGDEMNARLSDIEGSDVASLAPVGLRNGQSSRADAGPQTLGRSGAGKSSVDGGPGGAAVKSRVGLVETTGARPGQTDAIKAALDSYKRGIEACYQQALRDSPEIEGRLVLSVSVTAGKVTEAAVVENGTRDDGLAGCAELRARSWRFDTEVTVDLLAPFSLSR